MNQYAHDESISDYNKIKACYNYVRRHVTYLSDGQWKTHSCYAALINGKSTCQGYSLKGEAGFSKSPLQSRFLTSEFKKAYLNRIPLKDYSPSVPVRSAQRIEITGSSIVGIQKRIVLKASILPDSATGKVVRQ